MITKENILEDLKKVKDVAGCLPSMKIYKQHGKYDPTTICRHFGNWNNSLMECFGEIIKARSKNIVPHKCYTCENMTKNPKYCSSSCAAKINNSLFPKNPKRPQPIYTCSECGNKTCRGSYICSKCHNKKKIEEFGEKIISDFQSTFARHKYQGIRHHAHRYVKINNIDKKCHKCGYTLHTELCHKTPISEFDKSTKIKVVNSLDNLIYLCPTHHWELDHKKLIL